MEKEPKADLVKHLKKYLPLAVVFRHEDHFTSGIPDISVSWKGHTWWIEVKEFPGKKGRAIQNATACLLKRQGYDCFYVIYHKTRNRIYIVEPEKYDNWNKECSGSWSGYDHGRVIEWIKNSI